MRATKRERLRWAETPEHLCDWPPYRFFNSGLVSTPNTHSLQKSTLKGPRHSHRKISTFYPLRGYACGLEAGTRFAGKTAASLSEWQDKARSVFCRCLGPMPEPQEDYGRAELIESDRTESYRQRRYHIRMKIVF